MPRSWRRLAIGIAISAIGAGWPAAAGAAPSGAQQYVASWAPAYRTFARVYVSAYRPCLKGATRSCAQAQQLAASAAARTVSTLHSATPPASLAHDAVELTRDLGSADTRLSASAAAARVGNTSARVWCSAEQGPCTVVMIDMGNVVGDINFTAHVDLPLPA